MVTNYVAVGTILIIIFILSSIIIVKHIENLYNISKGTESTFWSVFNKK